MVSDKRSPSLEPRRKAAVLVETILDFLYTPAAFGHLLYMEFIVYLLALVLCLLGIAIACNAFRVNQSPDEEAHYKFVQCASCGWQGKVSRFVRTCPRCNDSNFVSKY